MMNGKMSQWLFGCVVCLSFALVAAGGFAMEGVVLWVMAGLIGVLSVAGFGKYETGGNPMKFEEGKIMKKKIGQKWLCFVLSFSLFFTLSFQANAEVEIAWEKFREGHFPSSVIQTQDHKFAISGKIGGNGFWIEKRDSVGNSILYKEFPGDDNFSIITTPEGEWVVASTTKLLKLNNQGGTVWEKPVNPVNEVLNEDAYRIGSITQTPEGGLAIAGNLGADRHYVNRELWFAKYDSDGNILRSKTYAGTTAYDYASSIIATADGGFAVVNTMRNTSVKLWILKLGSEGDLEWQKTFDKRHAGSIVQTMNGDLLVVTTIFTEGIVNDPVFFDFFGLTKRAVSYGIEVIRLDSAGNMIWNKTFSRSQFDYGVSVIETSDNNLIVTGVSDAIQGSSDYKAWVIQLNEHGNMLWNEVFEENGVNKSIYPVIETTDNYLVGAGGSGSKGWIIKFKHVSPSQPELSVTTAFHTVPGTNGISTFDVINTGAETMDWTAVSDVPWLTIKSGSPGTDSGTVTFSYDANSGDERIGTIKVTATGANNSPQIVKIKQAKVANPILVLPSDTQACPPAQTVSIPLTLNYATRDDLIHENIHLGADSVALSDIKNAYRAAQSFFIDYPNKAVSYADLITSGYTPTPGVTLTIVSGEQSTLSIKSSHVSGKYIYSIDSKGTIKKFESKSGDDFGLISQLQMAPYTANIDANSDIKNAYTAASAFFIDYPTKEVSYEELKNSGYIPTPGVKLTIKSGTLDGLAMESWHVNGTLIYSIDWVGTISEVETTPATANIKANTDIKNAYTAAQAFFIDYPYGELSYEELKNSGYTPTPGVKLTIKSGTLNGLAMESWHVNGTLIYSVDQAGVITSSPNSVSIDVIEMKVEFDNTVLSATGATLTGGVLENKNYEISYRTGDGYIVILIYAKDYEALFKGSGVIAYLNFDIIENGGTSTELTFVKSRINNRYVDTNIASVEVGCKPATVNFTVKGNGTLTGEASQIVEYGENSAGMTAVPDESYEFTGWSGDHAGTANPLIVENVTSDMNIIANFARHFELSDAILILKMLTGMEANGVSLELDANGNGKVGLEDVVCILQIVAEIRSQ